MKTSVVITGAGRGLGLALTEEFLERGYQVFAGCYHHEGSLNRLLKIYPDLTIIPLDVTDDNSVCKAFIEVSSQTESLDLLVNNAGIHLESTYNTLENIDFGEMSKTFEVNIFGPLRVTKAFIPLLEKGQRKMIANISSEAGSISDCLRETEYDYCMSKAALNMQSKILQNYLRPKGFQILVIHPGWMKTDMGGAEADITPEVAAKSIVELTSRNLKADDGIYMDYLGKPMRW